MYKPLVALGVFIAVAGCSTTQTAQLTAEECRIVEQDATESRISTRQECEDAAKEQRAGSSQQ